ncbi:hypothetical protein DBR39_08810 [Chryseobacterium sp. KBW03]|uniref:Uncharacterized protein n=1 Tax=Chryseobacterium viscerum TaxID=1037377 RepID=A0A316X229_9FLAO|nr:hypothetical protein C1634_000825 [Chryseobacterium viscerum]RQO39081.1 hypothetical protein DBR39_08810 [Chryseobacterium sp. KBW03]
MLNKVMTQCTSLKNHRILQKNQGISNGLPLFILIVGYIFNDLLIKALSTFTSLTKNIVYDKN